MQEFLSSDETIKNMEEAERRERKFIQNKILVFKDNIPTEEGYYFCGYIYEGRRIIHPVYIFSHQNTLYINFDTSRENDHTDKFRCGSLSKYLDYYYSNILEIQIIE